MAIVKNNQLTKGISGRVGDLVFSQRNGKTYVGSRRGSGNKPLTENQQEVLAKFGKCSLYAKRACSDPKLKAEYQEIAEPGRSAYQAAMKDAFHGTEILDISRFDDYVVVEASDNFKVSSVEVRVYDGEDLLEEGMAVMYDHNYWKYGLTIKRSRIPGVKIIVIVMDLPGNITEGEIIM